MDKTAVLENITDKVRITDISWERIFLSFTVESDLDAELSFGLRRLKRRRPKPKKGQNKADIPINKYILEEVFIRPERVEGDLSFFTLNIAAVNGREFLENGQWELFAYTEGREDVYTCSVSYELAYRLDDLSYVYRYAGGKCAYNISFSTFSEDGKTLALVLNSYFMIENSKWRKRRYVRETVNRDEKPKKFYMTLVTLLMRGCYQVLEHLSPKHGKKILFMTETKDFLWGNLKYIDDRIKERGLDKEFKLSYSLRNAVGTHKSVLSWAKLIMLISKQDYIFVDDYVPVFGFLTPNKRTKLIQVWHAGEGFKSVGYSRFGKAGSPYPGGSCHKKYDYVVTGSERLVHVYGEVFGLPEDVFFPVGMARLDGFLDEDRIRSVTDDFYGRYPELKGKKIILFAPTYRGAEQKFAYYDFDRLDFDEIYRFCGDEYVWAFKMHPFVTDPIPVPEGYEDRIIDLSSEKNINDLYYVTDILITDYSSAYFEYALMERPVLFFTYDREAYELTRGVHKSVKDTAPGKVCDTFPELMKALETGDYEIEKIRAFREANFSNYDGRAADKIIDRILLGKEI